MQKPELDTPKPKHTARAWLDRLFGARRIDFVTSMSLEKSAQLIEDNLNSQKGNWFIGYSTTTSTKIRPLDDDTYELILSRRSLNRPTINAQGYLKRWQSNSTYVSLRIKPFYEVAVVFLVIAFIFLFMLLAQPDIRLNLPWILLCLVPGLGLGFIAYLVFGYTIAADKSGMLKTMLGADYAVDE